MAINGKTLTAVEALVTATGTSEGNFRTGMDDVLTQVNSNEEVSSAVDDERDRQYGLIRDLRAGQWNYIARQYNNFTAAEKLAIFGSTNAERAGRYRFMVVGGGGGGRNQDSNTHWGGGAGGMVAFDYVWDGATAPTWTIGDHGNRNSSTLTADASTMTLSNGVAITAGAGGQGFSSRGAGGSAAITGTSTEVTNIRLGIGGRGGHRNGSGDSPGGGAVNVFGLGSDDTATEGRGGPSFSGGGGSVWGPGAVFEDGSTAASSVSVVMPGGHWMGSMYAGNSGTITSNIFNARVFGVGADTNPAFYSPGLFGGWGPNLVDTTVDSLFGGGGGGGSSPGAPGLIAWCRMGAS